MKILIRENKPCLYELSWKPRIPAILFKIHKDVIEKKGSVSDDAPIIRGLKERFNLKDFLTDFTGDFGFGGVFKNCGQDSEFIKFNIDIPIIESKDGKCDGCDGTGENKDLGECTYCDGSGDKFKYDWNLSYSISASFTVLLTFLYTIENEVESKLLQLLEVDTITSEGIHGGSLGGQFSIPLVNWLKKFKSSEDIPEIKKAMRRVYKHMFCNNIKYVGMDFRVGFGSSRNGRIIIDCPGDACGIHPAEVYCSDRDNEDIGYNFSCHNVDSPAQQLTLLVALAALHDRVRKEIK